MKERQHGIKDIDPGFLVFMIGVCHVKIYVKLAALLFFVAYLGFRRYRFLAPPSYVVFYAALIGLGAFSSWLEGSFSDPNYPFGFGFGSFVFLIAGAASYATYLAATQMDIHRLMASIKGFFGLNALYSLVIFFGLIRDSGHLMPYWYWDPQELYGSSTGDYLMGIFQSNSVTNAMVNLMGVIFFAYQAQLRWAILCLLICLMCTSNLTILFLVLALMGGIFLSRQKELRFRLVVILVVTAIFYPLLSPSNLKYINTTIEQGRDQEKMADGRGLVRDVEPALEPMEDPPWEETYRKRSLERKIRSMYKMPLVYGQGTLNNDLRYDYFFGTPWDPPPSNRLLKEVYSRDRVAALYGMKIEESPISSFYYPIKLFSYLQTMDHLTSDVKTFALGSGMGNFSSKLALKMTGLQMQGDYPPRRIYVHDDFLQYHYYTLLYVFSLPVSQHSTINMPNSVYNQLGGEYGILGLSLWVLLYFGYFFRRAGRRPLGIVLIALLVAFFGFEYWLEMISLTLIFELILLYVNRVQGEKPI